MATLVWIYTSNLILMHEMPMVNCDPVAKLSCIDSIHQQQKIDDALKVSGLIDKTQPKSSPVVSPPFMMSAIC